MRGFNALAIPICLFFLLVCSGAVDGAAGGVVSGSVYDAETGKGIPNVEVRAFAVGNKGISGRVVGPDGEPVAEAHVHVSHAKTRRSHGSALTDVQGRYSFANLSEGAYQVRVNYHRYNNEQRENIPAGSSNVDFVLTSYATITGRVVDASGTPFEEFQIRKVGGALKKVMPGPNGRFGSFTRVSNPQGRFLFEKVWKGDNTIMVRVPGYSTAFRVLKDVPPGESIDLTVVMERAGIVNGLIVDSTGKPVAGARVWAGPLPPRSHHGREETIAVTDAEGRFRSDMVPVDTTQLTVAHKDFLVYSHEVSLEPAQEKDVKIVLPSGGTVTGTVTFAGAPASGCYLSVGHGEGHNSAKVREDGTFTIEGLLPGTNAIGAYFRQPTQHPWKEEWYLGTDVVVEERETTRADLTYITGSAIFEGAISISGSPPKHGKVFFTVSHEPQIEEARSFTDSTGRFRLDHVPEGSWIVHIEASDAEYTMYRKEVTVEMRAGETTRLDVEFP